MSKYILKTEVPSSENLDLSKYILKTEVPSSENLDLTKYILKTRIPTMDPTKYIMREQPTTPNPDNVNVYEKESSNDDLSVQNGIIVSKSDSLYGEINTTALSEDSDNDTAVETARNNGNPPNDQNERTSNEQNERLSRNNDQNERTSNEQNERTSNEQNERLSRNNDQNERTSNEQNERTSNDRNERTSINNDRNERTSNGQNRSRYQKDLPYFIRNNRNKYNLSSDETLNTERSSSDSNTVKYKNNSLNILQDEKKIKKVTDKYCLKKFLNNGSPVVNINKCYDSTLPQKMPSNNFGVYNY